MLRFLLITIVIANSSYAGHYLSVGYDLVTMAKLEDNYATDGTNSSSGGDSEIDFEPGFSLGYEFRSVDPSSWGASFGLEYHAKRDLEEVTFSGTTFTPTSDDVANINIVYLYANLIYRWDVFYIPFGLNIASVEYTPADSYNGNVKSESGVGFNFALGWELGDSFLIEYGVKSSTYSLSEKSGSDEIDYGEGAIAVSTLSLKYKLF